jgi:lipoate-protein ligase A
MARDRALLEGAERGELGCRVYSWDGVWVSLGRFQRPEEALVQPETTPWVSRPTGGLAVLHGHDVTVALAIPLTILNLEGTRSLKAVYRAAISPLVGALRDCGLSAKLAEETPFVKGRTREGAAPSAPLFALADCFASTSPNDIVSERLGVKVCGCALRVTRKAVLVQSSIPAWSPEIPAERIILGGVSTPLLPWRHQDLAAALGERILACPRY